MCVCVCGGGSVRGVVCVCLWWLGAGIVTVISYNNSLPLFLLPYNLCCCAVLCDVCGCSFIMSCSFRWYNVAEQDGTCTATKSQPLSAKDTTRCLVMAW